MSVQNFSELYIDELRDLYSAETQLVQALPKVAEAASSNQLMSAIEEHLRQTKMQVERLESIFEDMDENPRGHTCKAMQGLIKEADEIIGEVEEGPLRDAAIIIMAQKVEHYEIAGYGGVRTLAQTSGYLAHVDRLQATLNEEKGADSKLTTIAESIVNREAVAQS